MGKFLVNKTATGFTFHLLATNGQTIATSEVYKSLASCKKGCESVMANAPIANLEDQTVENFEVQKHPKFEVYLDKAGEPRFRLKAKNGEVIASSQGYSGMDVCLKGVESVRKNAADAPIVIAE